MDRLPLPPDFTWKRGFISAPDTTLWLYCGQVAVAVVKFHNEAWRSTVNRHRDVASERTVIAPSQDVAKALDRTLGGAQRCPNPALDRRLGPDPKLTPAHC